MTQAWLYLQTASKRPKGASLSIYFANYKICEYVCVCKHISQGWLFISTAVSQAKMYDNKGRADLCCGFIQLKLNFPLHCIINISN